MIVKKINSKTIDELRTEKNPVKSLDTTQSENSTKQVETSTETNGTSTEKIVIPVNSNPADLHNLAEKLDQIAALNGKLDSLSRHFEGSRFEDILQNYANPWKVIRINLLVGLARGIGLTLGTAFFLGILIYVMSKTVSMPIIGEYIAELLKWIDTYRAY